MKDLFLYAVNYVLTVALTVSVAGSALFFLLRLSAFFLGSCYKVRHHYNLMRAAVLFCLMPAVVLAGTVVMVETDVEWGLLDTGYGVEAVSFADYFGIMMIENHKLNLVRVGIFAIWLTGFAVTFFCRLAHEKRALRRIMGCAVVWDAEPVERLRRTLARESGMGRRVWIYRSNMIKTPFSAGIYRPRIYFPEAELKEADIYRILKHEILHCKRGDIVYRLLFMLLRGMQWYNPLFAFFERDFILYSELACDEAALEYADTEERFCYAGLTLSMAAAEAGHIQAVCRTEFASRNEREMKKRMVHIMRGKQDLTRAAAVSGAIFFSALCPVTVYAASQGVAAVGRYVSEMAETEVSTWEKMEEYFDLEWTEMDKKPLSAEIGRATEKREIWRVLLKKGDTITIRIASDRKEDVFSVGLKDFYGKSVRRAESENGACLYTFRVDRTSDYIVFIEGRHPVGGRGIYVAGSIVAPEFVERVR